MLSYEEALAAIDAVPATPRSERVPLDEAIGRAIAETVTLNRDQPGFDRATMDGYAVRPDGDAHSFPVVGAIHAGDPTGREPDPGEAVWIMTGAAVPPDCTVVPVELTDGGEERVAVSEEFDLSIPRNVAWRGEDGRAGDAVVRPGTVATPPVLAAAAMAGTADLAVHPRPRVLVATTGDEVGAAGDTGIADSNGPLLGAAVAGLGCFWERRRVADRHEDLVGLFAYAAAQADVVLTTGGVSMGARDLVIAAALEAGFEEVFHKVAIQPGKPVWFGRHRDGCLALGLPGNPVSVLATFHLFFPSVLARMWPGFALPWFELPLSAPVRGRKPRRLFLPARLADGGVAPVPWNGSGDLLAAAHGHGLLDTRGETDLDPGYLVPFLPYLALPSGSAAELPPREAKGPGL